MNLRCLVLFLAFATCGLAQTTLFFDDFSGSSGTDLNGTAPDIRPGSETWVAGTGATAWKADGSASGGPNQNAFLAFTPVAGQIYTFSIDANPQSLSDAWFAVGFSATATAESFYASAINAGPWLLLRGERPHAGGIETFAGPNTSLSAGYAADDGFVSLSLVLDTREDNWAVAWRADDVTLREYVYTGSNPDIHYIAVGKYGNVAGSIDNLSLKQAAVPEPANVAVLVGTLAGAVVVLVRRRQAHRPASAIKPGA